MRKRSLLLIAGACLATLSLTVGSAIADPVNTRPHPEPWRALAGVGASADQELLNALSEVITDGTGARIIASYDAAGSPLITTKDPAVNPNCTFPRPADSSQGINALIAHTADGCLQFARSTINDSASRPGQNLTYIPFAVDAVSYSITKNSTLSRHFTIAQLTRIYNCDPAITFPSNPNGIKPLLPAFGSETRSFFLKSLGFTDTPNLGLQPGRTCIRDTDTNGNPLMENTGTLITDSQQLAPYSVAQWIAQVNGVVPDVHSETVLGQINSISPLLANPASPTPTYAITKNSTLSRHFTVAQLQTIYNCDPAITFPSNPNGIKALLPQFGTGTRRDFLAKLGVVDAPDFTAQPGHTCITQTDTNGMPNPEDTGTLLNDPHQLIPYSVAHWIWQVNGVVPDVHNETILGQINGISPLLLNTDSELRRLIYNLIHRRWPEPPPPDPWPIIDNTFVGQTSAVCSNPATIQRFGFATIPNCGSTTIQTP